MGGKKEENVYTAKGKKGGNLGCLLGRGGEGKNERPPGEGKKKKRREFSLFRKGQFPDARCLREKKDSATQRRKVRKSAGGGVRNERLGLNGFFPEGKKKRPPTLLVPECGGKKEKHAPAPQCQHEKEKEERKKAGHFPLTGKKGGGKLYQKAPAQEGEKASPPNTRGTGKEEGVCPLLKLQSWGGGGSTREKGGEKETTGYVCSGKKERHY